MAKTIAYLYTQPLLNAPPDRIPWTSDVDQVYQDWGDRHQLQQLLHDCQTDPAQTLLIRQWDELGDSVEEVIQRLDQLRSWGVEVQASDAPPDQTSLGWLQAIQYNQQSRRIRQGHARNRVKALPPPGKAPYGYQRGKERYTIDRTVAPIVKDFFEQFLLYGSLRGAVRHLEKRHGKKISASTGHSWLTNPIYHGDLKYQDGRVVLNTHTPIVSRDEAAQVDRLLQQNHAHAPRTASAPRSLSGLVTCAQCQSSMTISRVTDRQRIQEYVYLRLTACPDRPKCSAIPYEQVLDQTIHHICQDLPCAVAEQPMPDLEPMKQRITGAIETKQQILTQLPNLVTAGILDPETAELRSYNLRTELASLQSKLAQFPPVNLKAIAQTVSIPEFWLDLSESERRFYFREFIRQIQLIRHPDRTWTIHLIFVFQEQA